MRCASVIRGTSTPLDVEVISSNEDLFGDVVPMPAAPVEGKTLVCACKHKLTNNVATITVSVLQVFI